MTGRIVVVPTENLQELVLRAVANGRTKYNYAVGFKETSGWGISLAIAQWCLDQGPDFRYVKR